MQSNKLAREREGERTKSAFNMFKIFGPVRESFTRCFRKTFLRKLEDKTRRVSRGTQEEIGNRMQKCKHTQTYTCIYTGTHMACVYIHTQHSCALTHIHACTHIYIHTSTHVHTHIMTAERIFIHVKGHGEW